MTARAKKWRATRAKNLALANKKRGSKPGKNPRRQRRVLSQDDFVKMVDDLVEQRVKVQVDAVIAQIEAAFKKRP